MTPKKVGDLTVNDGKGLLDNDGICDSLIENLNGLLKSMAAGQWIRVCSITIEMVQKLQNLKQGIRADIDSMKEQIRGLEELNNELAEKAFGLPVDRENGITPEE